MSFPSFHHSVESMLKVKLNRSLVNLTLQVPCMTVVPSSCAVMTIVEMPHSLPSIRIENSRRSTSTAWTAEAEKASEIRQARQPIFPC